LSRLRTFDAERQLPTPAYAPIWKIESNRLQYIGPRTDPDLRVARAIWMAVSLPLFRQPMPLDGGLWCDGGIVDSFPVHPILDTEPPADVVAVNAFYPPGFAGEDESGWHYSPARIMHIARQVRSRQQVQVARENLARLRASTDVELLEPVPYWKVRATGFLRTVPRQPRLAGLHASRSRSDDRSLAPAKRGLGRSLRIVSLPVSGAGEAVTCRRTTAPGRCQVDYASVVRTQLGARRRRPARSAAARSW
jgi:hypothetical protein